jgi:hypothetical protein
MVTQEQLAERRAMIEASPDLTALRGRLVERAEPVIRRMPPVPQLKALLSREGGLCSRDGEPLIYDPWSPANHRCSVCGNIATGERQDRHWAKLQHLWLAERAAHLAAVAALGDHQEAASRSAEILSAYQPLYFELPNRDNVLGPTHLFFSTYLESIWILNYLAAATSLRESGLLPDDVSATVDAIADEAANIIGDFNEGYSNRQTWHAAALTAIAAWFGDEDLARSSIEGRTGLVGHLADGFGDDGTWYEGENYHLFALRGLLTGLGWARMLGADILDDPEVADHLRRALLAPALTALPDLTFPARKDSRFGVSLAQPMYLEMWEIGRGMLGPEDDELASWLSALYQSRTQPAVPFESYLHEAGEPAPPSRKRSDLSWWSLLGMTPDLTSTRAWEPESRHFRSQGLAVLRLGDRYASLECGSPGGGHGHPDRLHLTVHAGGVHWLPDFGTGSYVSRDLFWYRSTLAHNAPLLDGKSQAYVDATCEMFDVQAHWGWVRGRFKECDRIVVAGPEYLVDVVTCATDAPRQVDLPWHLVGETSVETGGRWEAIAPDALASEFVRTTERFVPDGTGPVVLRGTVEGKSCRILLLFDGELLRSRAPGPPGSGEQSFFVIRGSGPLVRTVAVIDPAPGGKVTGLSHEGDVITVVHTSTDRHTPLLEGWQIESGEELVRLAGVERAAAQPEPIITRERIDRPEATAPWIGERPALDGSPAGFDLAEPLTMDTELQYRRSEEPYADPEYFSATGWINWSDEELYFLVAVTKSEPWFRPRSAPPLDLDNEADDIHSDGLQLYLKQGDRVLGFLVVPEGDSNELRVSPAGPGDEESSMVTGAWSLTPQGYCVTLAVKPGWILDTREPLEVDLLVNEMRPERQRRAGQLVWSGGGGWVYLRGDRQDASRFGILTLTP